MSKINLNEIIVLNVGGQMYETRRQTLFAVQGSFLAKMVSGESLDHEESNSGCYFIDRDGTHFRFILNYLRNGELPDEVLSEFGAELHPEAVFYGLTGLADQITARKGNQRPAKPVNPRSAGVGVTDLTDLERGVLPGQFRFVFDGGEIVETGIVTLQTGLPEFWKKIKDYSSKQVYYLDLIEPEILEIILQFLKTGVRKYYSSDKCNAIYKAAKLLNAPHVNMAMYSDDF